MNPHNCTCSTCGTPRTNLTGTINANCINCPSSKHPTVWCLASNGQTLVGHDGRFSVVGKKG